MFKRNLTSRDFLKIRSCEEISGAAVLTTAERIAQAEFAQTVRNFFFATKETMVRYIVLNKAQVFTTPFADPLILTDLLQMHDYAALSAFPSNLSRFLLRIVELGVEGKSEGQNFLGVDAFPAAPGAEFILKYEKNYSHVALTNNERDIENKYLAFVPRLLKPNQFLFAEWIINSSDDVNFVWPFQLGARAVRVLTPGNPYRELSALTRSQVTNYVSSNKPETFFLEVRTPLASIPAAPLRLSLKTPQMGRPLLILGAASNLEGCQGGLYLDSEDYRFTFIDTTPQFGFFATAAPLQMTPLSLWAPNADFRNTNCFNMWPVPHLLAPGAELRILLSSGLMANGGGGFQQVKKTRSNQDARITFICRTV